MNRRDFLRIMLATAAAEAVDFEKLLWIPKPIITVPSLPATMYGIPYHETNWSTGAWLGIPRGEAYNEIVKLVQLMNKEK